MRNIYEWSPGRLGVCKLCIIDERRKLCPFVREKVHARIRFRDFEEIDSRDGHEIVSLRN